MFKENLDLILKRKKINGKELCEKLKIPNSNYTHWKNSPPRADILIKISEVLDISIDFLLTGKTENYTREEIELINKYRESDKRGKGTIINIADLEARRSRSEAAGAGAVSGEDELKPFA